MNQYALRQSAIQNFQDQPELDLVDAMINVYHQGLHSLHNFL